MATIHSVCTSDTPRLFYIYASYPNESFFDKNLEEAINGNIPYIAEKLFKTGIIAYKEHSRGVLIPEDQIGKSGNFQCLLEKYSLAENDLCNWNKKILLAVPETSITNTKDVSLLEAPTTQVTHTKDVGETHGLIRIFYPPSEKDKKIWKEHVRVRNILLSNLIPYLGIKLRQDQDFYFYKS